MRILKFTDITPKDYLKQFKKSYSERTPCENIIVECLYHLEVESKYDQMRMLGGMEGALIVEGFLKQGVNFDFKQETKKFIFIEYKSTETYKDFIIRKGKEFLKEKGVM